jgi:quercetin dioxygenase-like cupin family protein
MENIIKLNEQPYFLPMDGLKAKVVHTKKQTIAFWEIEKDAVLPAHQHMHEQLSIVTSGELELTIAGKTQIMKPGMVAVIPANEIHSAVALSHVEVTDIFLPAREDFK